MRTLLIYLLLIAAAYGEAVAVIDGPQEAKPGDLVVLSGKQSTGAGFRWISPQGVQTLTCSELELAFAVGTPGRYTFWLIAADTEANIDYATWTVTVGTPRPPVPDPEPEPEPPDTPTDPPPVLQKLKEASRDSAASLADPTTAKALAAAIRSVSSVIESECAQMQCPTTTEAIRRMSNAIENVLALRRGPSLSKNWLDGWRRPINAALGQLGQVTSKDYAQAMRAIATGLEESI